MFLRRIVGPLVVLAAAACAATGDQPAQTPSVQTPEVRRSPVIDMHLHAMAVSAYGPPPVAMCTPAPAMPTWDPARPYLMMLLQRLKQPLCDDPVWSPTTDEALMRETIAAMERSNVVGVLSGRPERVAAWRAAAPERFLPGFELLPGDSVEQLKQLHADGKLKVLAEVAPQYGGGEPTDPPLEPFWALAEQLDIPVGIHIGPGPPGAPYGSAPKYRARLHSPLILEEVLVRHPRLRVYVMHAGYPMLDDTLALLYTHPQVHVDTGVIVYMLQRVEFYRYVQRLVEAGFGKRILFGSDQMVWPGTIERSIAVIREAPFLTEEQKDDILYGNAARFLRLTPEQTAAHRAAAR